MAGLGYLSGAIAVMALATFATRAAPFLLLGRHAGHPLLQYLGRYLPAAVMLLLVIYTLKDVAFTRAPFGLHHLAAIAVTAGLHAWRRHALLSIASGTATFMVLLRLLP